MIGQDCEIRFELLKSILSNPSNKLSEIDVNVVSEKLDRFIQEIWKDSPRKKSQSEAKP
jgi:hypothetical protein